jgi:cell shape-determining protein MreD
MNIELIGIAATVFVLISFLMKDAAKIRKVNIIGAALFVVYGLLIGSLSVWLLNGVLVFAHVRFLLMER